MVYVSSNNKGGGSFASKNAIIVALFFAQSVLILLLLASRQQLDCAKIETDIMPRSLVSQSSKQLLYGTMEHPFATTASEFKTQLLNIVKDDKNLYTKQDIELMSKALRLIIDFAGSGWRLSGKTSRNHVIGTGSCMLHQRAPAEYVSLALLHIAYFAIWSEQAIGESSHPFFFADDLCARRRWIRDQMGEKFESILWRYNSLHSGAPERADPIFWLAALDSDVLSIEDKNIIAFNLCDEVEQYQSYEQLWINNNRKRRPAWQANFIKTFDMLATDPLFSNVTFGAVQEYTKKVFEQTNNWYITGETQHSEGMDKTELEFKNTFEEVFQKTSYIPHINWAHIPEVKKFRDRKSRNVYKNTTVVLEDWEVLTSWWEGVCCNDGGPCRSGARAVTLSQEMRDRWNLPESNKMSRNTVGLACLDRGKCRGVKEGQLPLMSGIKEASAIKK